MIDSKKLRAPDGASAVARRKSVGKTSSIRTADTKAMNKWFVNSSGPT